MSRAPRVLFLYLPTGGGHVSNAKAIGGVLEARYGAEVKIYDPVAAGSEFGRVFMEDGYRIVSLKAPFIWKAMFRAHEHTPNIKLSQAIAGAMARRGLEAVLDEFKPDLVVCVHHLLLAELTRALRSRPSVKAAVVVTDPFVPPRIWALGHEYPMLCYSAEAVESLAAMGVPRERLSAYSIIINDKFSRRPSPEERAAAIRALGLEPDEPFVLIAGGGDGIRGAERILEELGRSELPFQLAVVCGRDALTKERAEHVAARLINMGRRTQVYGFTDKMYELITGADVVVSKAGPAVLGEVLAAGKPNMVAYFIPGQEEPNMRWIERMGVGRYCPTPQDARRAAEDYLTDPELRARMAAAIEAVGFKNGLYDISAALMAPFGPKK